tara:strand:- start:95 stop:1291 length:1197 start_codon:yes stop_codon:yes gene_type:complete
MKLCTCCGEKKSVFIDLGIQPYANKYPLSHDIQKEFLNNLTILICENCFSCTTESIAPRDEMFEEYFYLSSVNKELVNHFNNFAKTIPKGSSVLDIGSNDGILLKPLIENGVNALGIDPSENVGELANKNGLKTIIGFFDENNTKKIKNEYGKFDYVVASSIFTHVEEPHSFISNLNEVLEEDGYFILEIEYIRNIVSNIEFERFYFDRPFYYSIKGIKTIFEKYNLFINKIEEINPHGGSLRFYISKSKETSNKIEHLIEQESKFFKRNLNNKFKSLAINEADKLKEFLKNKKREGKKVIGFGCPARFSTITNFVNIDSELLPFVVDDSPIKQGKLSPGKHVPIVSRNFLKDFKPDVIIVFAYEYFDSIYEFTSQFGAEHYKPIPLTKLEKSYESNN